MTCTLRDRLAAVLGPGNDDTTAYQQADAVLDILLEASDLREALWDRLGARVISRFDEQAPVEYWSVEGTSQYGLPEKRLVQDLPSKARAAEYADEFCRLARQSGGEPITTIRKQHGRYGRAS